jgi:small GTP-binding protein
MLPYNYTLKFIIIGDSSVGKSNIMNVFVNNNFQDVNESTVGVEFASKIIRVSDLYYRIRIWDTAGQETFRSITSAYYRGTDACLIVYSVTDRKSFESVVSWIIDIRTKSINNIAIALVGNKIDEERQVSTEEGEKIAAEYGLLFFETSAKTTYNINNVFTTIIKKINIKQEPEPQTVNIQTPINNSFWSYC